MFREISVAKLKVEEFTTSRSAKEEQFQRFASFMHGF
jgi:hypothetical protein